MAIVTSLSFISHSSIVLATQIHDTIFNTNYTIHYCVTYRRQKLITFCVKATNKAHKVQRNVINCWWRSRNDSGTLRTITVPTPMFLCSHSHPYLNPIPVGIPFPWELPFPRTPLLLAGSLHTTHSAAGNVFLVASEICGWTSQLQQDNNLSPGHQRSPSFDVDIIQR